MISRYEAEFNGAEEIVAKKNKDGTYFITLKAVAKEEDSGREFDVVVNIPRGSIAISALAPRDDSGVMYSVNQTDREPANTELPEHIPSQAEWRMLGYDLSELPGLVQEQYL